jgi:hypothetical protein
MGIVNSEVYADYTLVKDYDKKFQYSSKNPNRICIVRGCGCVGHDITPANAIQTKRRPLCHDHYFESLTKRRGITMIQFRNSWHPYRKYRKDYCENIDGRLGYKCTSTIVWEGQLQVDHINGKPTDNRPKNLQTLCACCHVYKSNINEDYATPGRKTLKMMSN